MPGKDPRKFEIQKHLDNFCSEVAKEEAKNVEVSIGNIREILRVADEKLNGKLYILIKEKYS